MEKTFEQCCNEVAKKSGWTGLKQGQWIYWRWRKDGKAFSKSKIQDVIETDQGTLLELGDDLWTGYPNRILVKEVDILKQ